MNERVYNKEIKRLRSPERREKLNVENVIEIILEDKTIKTILDIGTGSGLFAEEFSNKNIKVYGIDSNPEMIEAAKHYVPAGDFNISKAEQLPFEDNKFDTVFFGLVLHEVDDFFKALKEAKRVSKNTVYALEWKYVEAEFGPPLEHRLREEFIKQLAEEAGFDKLNVIEVKDLILYKFN